ncbi:MAG: class I SAM-dependent methyltransferase [Pseudomonadales bacterium]
MQTVDYEIFQLSPGDVVLDLGCGEGRHVISAYLEKDIQAVGVDLSWDDLKLTREKFTPFADSDNDSKHFSLSVANALHLPFADNSFDKVICSEVLEHIPDWQDAIVEINRVLKPGGVFCASVPRFWPEKICWFFSDEYHANVGGHLRIFKASALRDTIEKQGLSHYRRHWAHALHSPYWWLQCMFWEKRDQSRLVRWYHSMLVWDMMERPWLTRTLERIFNPIMGKSVVMYFRKGAAS